MMKKFRLLPAFMFGLFFVLVLSSCELKKTSSQSSKKPVLIEFIEHNYLVLKPSDITRNSYKNPRNIFLEIKSCNNGGSNTANWYKKTNGVYQIFSLNDTFGRNLDQNLVYEIIDTVNLTQKISDYRSEYVESVESAYSNKPYVIKQISEQKHLTNNFWTKVEVTKKDSVLKYNSKTKSFFTTTTKPIIEIQNDFGPIIFVFIFLLLSLSVMLRDRVKWLKKLRQNLFRNSMIESINNDYQFNSTILFYVFLLFNFVYLCVWSNDWWPLLLFKALLFALLTRLLFWVDAIKMKDHKIFDIKRLYSVILITAISSLEISYIMNMSRYFLTISLVIIISPAIVDTIWSLIDYRKWKKSLSKLDNAETIG